jgi:hypothetical protein
MKCLLAFNIQRRIRRGIVAFFTNKSMDFQGNKRIAKPEFGIIQTGKDEESAFHEICERNSSVPSGDHYDDYHSHLSAMKADCPSRRMRIHRKRRAFFINSTVGGKDGGTDIGG